MGTEKRERQKQARRERLDAEAALTARANRMRALRRVGILTAVIVVLVVGYAFLAGGDGGSDDDAAAGNEPDLAAEPSYATYGDDDYGSGECPPAEGAAEPVIDFEDAPQRCIEPGEPLTAVFDTSEGEIRVALDTVDTVGTANNFATLARYGYYDSNEIFRTDPGIGIVQTGAPHTNSPGDPGPGYTIRDEGVGFTYEPGQLVMARTGAVNSSSAQVFFTANEAAAQLNDQGTYVVFGEVEAGLDVVQAILDLHEPEEGNALGGAPSRPVTIESVTIESSGPAAS